MRIPFMRTDREASVGLPWPRGIGRAEYGQSRRRRRRPGPGRRFRSAGARGSRLRLRLRTPPRIEWPEPRRRGDAGDCRASVHEEPGRSSVPADAAPMGSSKKMRVQRSSFAPVETAPDVASKALPTRACYGGSQACRKGDEIQAPAAAMPGATISTAISRRSPLTSRRSASATWDVERDRGNSDHPRRDRDQGGDKPDVPGSTSNRAEGPEHDQDRGRTRPAFPAGSPPRQGLRFDRQGFSPAACCWAPRKRNLACSRRCAAARIAPA